MKVENYPKKMMIRDVHIADRPRERLIRQGAESLSNQELIAILLRTGTRKESVLALANRLLKSVDKIQDLQFFGEFGGGILHTLMLAFASQGASARSTLECQQRMPTFWPIKRLPAPQ